MSTPHAPMPTRDLLAALAVVWIWGINFVAMRWALDSFTPFQLGAVRYLFAVLPLVFFVRRPQVAWRWLVLFGLCQGVGQFGFLFLAMRVGMTAGLASVLLQTQVFFTALLAFWVLHERPGRPLLWGLGLAALGLACFVVHELRPRQGPDVTTLAGLGLMLCAAAMWASSNIVARMAQRESPGYHPLGFIVWISLVPILPFMGLSALFDPDASRWLDASTLQAIPWLGWASAAYLGWMSSVVGYGLWTYLLTRHPANRVAPFSLGVPVVGLAAGLWVLGEPVAPWQWAGVALVVAALGCVVLGPRWIMAKMAARP